LSGGTVGSSRDGELGPVAQRASCTRRARERGARRLNNGTRGAFRASSRNPRNGNEGYMVDRRDVRSLAAVGVHGARRLEEPAAGRASRYRVERARRRIRTGGRVRLPRRRIMASRANDRLHQAMPLAKFRGHALRRVAARRRRTASSLRMWPRRAERRAIGVSRGATQPHPVAIHSAWTSLREPCRWLQAGAGVWT
jgi:hypothetical protein